MFARRSSLINFNRHQSDDNIENLSLEELSFKYLQLQNKHNAQLLKNEELADSANEQREQISQLQSEVKSMGQLRQQLQSLKIAKEALEDQKEVLQAQNEEIRLRLDLLEHKDKDILENSKSNISLSGFKFRKEIYEKE